MAVRVAVGDGKQVSVAFPSVADGAVTVTVESSRDETTLGPFATTHLGEGVYAYTLQPTMVAAVDVLKLVFSGDVGGYAFKTTQWVDVAGAYYFTTQEARAIGPIAESFSDSDIERHRTAVEDQIEANCDTSFVARFVTERVNGRGQALVRLTENYILRLIECVEDSTDVTSSVDLDGRYLWADGTWAVGRRNIAVKYEMGYQEYPPEDLRRKAIEATRYGLNRERRTGMPAQAVTIGTDVGTLRLAVAGLKQPFGIPEVDAVVLEWARSVAVPVDGV